MSLTSTQKRQTATEFTANLGLSGLTRQELQAATGLPQDRFEAALAVENADPSDVWLIRDTLEKAVQDAGATLVPFSVLTETMRGPAAAWFGLPSQTAQ